MSDSKLVALASGGDRSAFDELDARHREHVHAQCLGIVRDRETAQDCVQEALLRAYLALPNFRHDSKFSTWLHVIARNACLMRLRKKRLETVPLDRPVVCSEGTVEREVADPLADTSADVLLDELGVILVEQVERLSPAYKDIYELRIVQGLSTRETALQLRLSDAAVKSRLHRARTSLRDGLSAMGYASYSNA